MDPKMRSKMRISLALIAMLVLGGVVGAISVGATISSTPSAIDSQYSCEKGINAVIAVDNGGNYYTIQGSGSTTVPCGTLVAKGTNFATLVNNALASGGHVALEGGTFILPASTRITLAVAGTWLSGQGRSTNITTATGFASDIIAVTGNFVRVSDIGIDGRNQPHSSAYAGINLLGLNDSAINNYIQLVDHCGIDTQTGNNYLIEGNFVYNDHDDGICPRNTGGVVVGNTVQKVTLHNCYSIVVGDASTMANRITLTGNACYNSSNYGIAIEGNTVTNVVISSNVVDTSIIGMALFTKSGCTPGLVAQNVTITGNLFLNSNNTGIQLNGSTCGMSGININGNTITGVKNGGGLGYGIGITGASTFTNIEINNNLIKKTATACVSVSGSTVNRLTIDSNQMSLCGTNGITIANSATVSHVTINGNGLSDATASAIDAINLNAFSIVGNTITTPNAQNCLTIRGTSTTGAISGNSCSGTTGNVGIFLVNLVTYVTVTGNVVSGYSNGGLKDATSSDFNSFIGNTIQSGGGTPIAIVGTHDIVTDNQGFNPVAASIYTACASVCTYTNVDGYDEVFFLHVVNGISAWTCVNQNLAITVAAVDCVVPPGDTMVITWTVTAPTFAKIPLVG